MISEELLLLYSYGDELPLAEQQRIERALAEDETLAKRYASLLRDLDGAVSPVGVSTPPELISRLHAALDDETGATAQDWQAPWRGFAVAATLVLAVLSSVIYLRIDTVVPPVADIAIPNQTTNFERLLRTHLRQAQTTLEAAEDQTAVIRAQRASELATDNRGLVRAANAANKPQYARLLRGFQPLLQTVADESASATHVALVSEQVRFEMRVVLTKLTDAASNSV